MAPEQASGHMHKITAAADIYSLGAILYEFLTSVPPFLAATPMAILMKVQKEDPVPPRQLNKHAPVDLQTICLKCLEKDPGRRYVSAQTLAEDLDAWMAGKPISCRPMSGIEKTVRWLKRRIMSVVIAIMAAALAVLTVVTIQSFRKAEQQRGRNKPASTFEVAQTLMSKGKYQVAREMFQEALQEATTPQQMLEIEEALRRIDKIKKKTAP